MVENLETRRLFAGNVTAAINGAGELVVTGDNKSNDVTVFVNGSFDTIVIAVPGTTVNGGTADVNFGNSLPDIVISTGNGEDNVVVGGTVDQNVSITTGNGGDRVEVNNGGFSDTDVDDLTIDTGNGNDVVIVALDSNNDEVDGDLSIHTGNGSDFIRLAGNIDVLGDVDIDGGHGPDTLDDDGLDTVGGTTTVSGIETLI